VYIRDINRNLAQERKGNFLLEHCPWQENIAAKKHLSMQLPKLL